MRLTSNRPFLPLQLAVLHCTASSDTHQRPKAKEGEKGEGRANKEGQRRNLASSRHYSTFSKYLFYPTPAALSETIVFDLMSCCCELVSWRARIGEYREVDTDRDSTPWRFCAAKSSS